MNSSPITTADPTPEVAAIRARMQAASPGPWTLERSTRDGEKAATPLFAESMGDPGFPVSLAAIKKGQWFYNEFLADLEFVAHARTDIEMLLDALDRADNFGIGEWRATSWAYEQACSALENHRQRADAAESALERVKAIELPLSADALHEPWREGFEAAMELVEAAVGGDA